MEWIWWLAWSGILDEELEKQEEEEEEELW